MFNDMNADDNTTSMSAIVSGTWESSRGTRVDLLQMLEFNVTVSFPAAPLLTVILALVVLRASKAPPFSARWQAARVSRSVDATSRAAVEAPVAHERARRLSLLRAPAPAAAHCGRLVRPPPPPPPPHIGLFIFPIFNIYPIT
ncbi:Membralin [Eumeta japonica]|uniref:Membralin n=1 Tax=Eumeta variegata TaxID=151549 RepID=A0A4C1Z7I0_EUMVA|nr:Membralin [Eumeta japonica]